MSYANGTPNFNLPQTVSSDKRDWVDTNQAFADVDAALAGAVTDSGTALTNAAAAQTTADDAATTAAGAVTTANAASATATSASEQAALASTTANNAASAAAAAQTTADGAVTTANAASATASNADTVALQAQADIGTLSQLQTTDKSSLVAAINEVLGQIGGAMPTLNYTTPLHTFDTGHLSYTAVKECYLMGCVAAGSSGGTPGVSINGHEVALAPNSATLFISPLKISTGDTITVTQAAARLFVYEEATV